MTTSRPSAKCSTATSRVCPGSAAARSSPWKAAASPSTPIPAWPSRCRPTCRRAARTTRMAARCRSSTPSSTSARPSRPIVPRPTAAWSGCAAACRTGTGKWARSARAAASAKRFPAASPTATRWPPRWPTAATTCSTPQRPRRRCSMRSTSARCVRPSRCCRAWMRRSPARWATPGPAKSASPPGPNGAARSSIRTTPGRSMPVCRSARPSPKCTANARSPPPMPRSTCRWPSVWSCRPPRAPIITATSGMRSRPS
ncbi:hypothetical protein D3C87_688750 [compost metagenome]